jgi:pimeloyl-ACP methyl ester carboxylesterase
VTDAVILLHGWPGSAADFRRVVPLLEGRRVLVPDLFRPGTDELDDEWAAADRHAGRLLDLVRAEGLERPVVAGYDVGSRIAQALARLAPDALAGVVVTPAYPGIADRTVHPAFQAHAWYQHFHRLDLSAELLDGDARAVRAYLGHFWRTWSADPALAGGEEFDALVASYARPGAFRRSTAWYRANRGYAASEPVRVPTVMLWPAADPLFPVPWADAVGEWFTDVRLVTVPGCGHFVPLEAPEAFAAAVTAVGG